MLSRTTSGLQMTALALCAVLGGMSCQSLPEGYWTRGDRSQALTNQQYPADSRRCEELVERDGSGKSHAYNAGLFTRCMQANGYQWIVSKPHAHPANAALEAPSHTLACPTGRLVNDALGYPSCVPVGAKDRGAPSETVLSESVPQVPPHVPDDPRNDPFLEPTPQPVARRATDDGVCRQYAKESLSSTYSVYTQCMQDKGWDSKPGP